MSDKIENGITRREALGATAAVAAGAALATVAWNSACRADSSRAVKKEIDGKMTTTISLDWNEVYYTNCPLISASNVDQELGWTAEEFGKASASNLPISARAPRPTGTRTTFTTRKT